MLRRHARGDGVCGATSRAQLVPQVTCGPLALLRGSSESLRVRGLFRPTSEDQRRPAPTSPMAANGGLRARRKRAGSIVRPTKYPPRASRRARPRLPTHLPRAVAEAESDRHRPTRKGHTRRDRRRRRRRCGPEPHASPPSPAMPPTSPRTPHLLCARSQAPSMAGHWPRRRDGAASAATLMAEPSGAMRNYQNGRHNRRHRHRRLAVAARTVAAPRSPPSPPSPPSRHSPLSRPSPHSLPSGPSPLALPPRRQCERRGPRGQRVRRGPRQRRVPRGR